ncbi:MAG: exo-alpha-sialidase, partial [Clostridia bacterium]|nr:exo-alpha-sialidase [Clostridia bacterium]
SDDDGATWTSPAVLEEEEGHGYCYPSIFFTDDGCLMTSYCSGGDEDGICLAKTTIRKIEIGD